MQAIRRAAEPGQEPDRRLFQVRAALGLSESVPSDAGFLLEPSFSKEIFKVAFSNSQLSGLCRDIPIGPNSNSVKVNAIAEGNRTVKMGWHCRILVVGSGNESCFSPQIPPDGIYVEKVRHSLL